MPTQTMNPWVDEPQKPFRVHVLLKAAIGPAAQAGVRPQVTRSVRHTVRVSLGCL